MRVKMFGWNARTFAGRSGVAFLALTLAVVGLATTLTLGLALYTIHITHTLAISCTDKLAFHDADTDTDTDTNILADILARIVARMSACRSACHRNFRKSRVSDVSARILAMMSVSVSASWNSSYIRPPLLELRTSLHPVLSRSFPLCPLLRNSDRSTRQSPRL